ncbi:MAG: hypothetical protein OXB88_08180 [Bacteriovoracales bacterium]|nr:hypothetical protein [Bacteriovoracales bacterium]
MAQKIAQNNGLFHFFPDFKKEPKKVSVKSNKKLNTPQKDSSNGQLLPMLYNHEKALPQGTDRRRLSFGHFLCNGKKAAPPQSATKE